MKSSALFASFFWKSFRESRFFLEGLPLAGPLPSLGNTPGIFPGGEGGRPGREPAMAAHTCGAHTHTSRHLLRVREAEPRRPPPDNSLPARPAGPHRPPSRSLPPSLPPAREAAVPAGPARRGAAEPPLLTATCWRGPGRGRRRRRPPVAMETAGRPGAALATTGNLARFPRRQDPRPQRSSRPGAGGRPA